MSKDNFDTLGIGGDYRTEWPTGDSDGDGTTTTAEDSGEELGLFEILNLGDQLTGDLENDRFTVTLEEIVEFAAISGLSVNDITDLEGVNLEVDSDGVLHADHDHSNETITPENVEASENVTVDDDPVVVADNGMKIYKSDTEPNWSDGDLWIQPED